MIWPKNVKIQPSSKFQKFAKLKLRKLIFVKNKTFFETVKINY